MLKQIYCESNTTCASHSLQKKKVIKKILSGLLGSLIFSLFIAMVISSAGVRIGSGSYASIILINWIIIFIIIFSFLLIRNIFYFRNYFYDFKKEQIIIKKGFIAQREITVYYSKIQNVFVDQDVLDRIFSLYDVHIATADVQSMEMAHVDGLNKKDAEILRDLLLEKIKESSADKSI